ncbi:MAG: hypothetical protein V8S99_11920 [Oscillospiraceae bacterium]
MAIDRKGLDGIVFAGGVCTVIPEPLAVFIDFFSIGEGEESTREIIKRYPQPSGRGGANRNFCAMRRSSRASMSRRSTR